MVSLVNNFHFSGKSIGGTRNMDYVVTGSHREVPQELIEELSVICKVLTVSVSLLLKTQALVRSNMHIII